MPRAIDIHNLVNNENIDKAIRFFIYVLVFWLPYSPAVIENCVCISLGLWLLKRSLLLSQKNFNNILLRDRLKEFLRAFRPRPNFLDIPIVCFLAACLLSVFGSPLLGRSIHGFFAKTLEWFVIYYLVLEVFRNRRHIEIALAIFVFSSLATCLDSIVQFHWMQRDIFCSRIIPKGSGATAGFKTYNNLGGYLTFVVPLIFFRLFSAGQKRYAFFWWAVVFGLVMWSTAITFSRGSWAAIFLGVLLCLFFSKKKKLFFVFIVLALAVVCAYFLVPPEWQGKDRLSLGGILQTSGLRIDLWVESLKMIQDRPVFGHGLNTYMVIFQAYRAFPIFDPTYAHNCYIQLAAETGIVGLVCYLWIMARLLKKAIAGMSVFRLEGGNLPMAFVGLSGGVAAFLAHSFVDTDFYSLQLSSLFWLMAGFLMALDNVLNNDANRDIKIA